eukprot:67016_1
MDSKTKHVEQANRKIETISEQQQIIESHIDSLERRAQLNPQYEFLVLLLKPFLENHHTELDIKLCKLRGYLKEQTRLKTEAQKSTAVQALENGSKIRQQENNIINRKSPQNMNRQGSPKARNQSNSSRVGNPVPAAQQNTRKIWTPKVVNHRKPSPEGNQSFHERNNNINREHNGKIWGANIPPRNNNLKKDSQTLNNLGRSKRSGFSLSKSPRSVSQNIDVSSQNVDNSSRSTEGRSVARDQNRFISSQEQKTPQNEGNRSARSSPKGPNRYISDNRRDRPGSLGDRLRKTDPDKLVDELYHEILNDQFGSVQVHLQARALPIDFLTAVALTRLADLPPNPVARYQKARAALCKSLLRSMAKHKVKVGPKALELARVALRKMKHGDEKVTQSGLIRVVYELANRMFPEKSRKHRSSLQPVNEDVLQDFLACGNTGVPSGKSVDISDSASDLEQLVSPVISLADSYDPLNDSIDSQLFDAIDSVSAPVSPDLPKRFNLSAPFLGGRTVSAPCSPMISESTGKRRLSVPVAESGIPESSDLKPDFTENPGSPDRDLEDPDNVDSSPLMLEENYFENLSPRSEHQVSVANNDCSPKVPELQDNIEKLSQQLDRKLSLSVIDNSPLIPAQEIIEKLPKQSANQRPVAMLDNSPLVPAQESIEKLPKQSASQRPVAVLDSSPGPLVPAQESIEKLPKQSASQRPVAVLDSSPLIPEDIDIEKLSKLSKRRLSVEIPKRSSVAASEKINGVGLEEQSDPDWDIDSVLSEDSVESPAHDQRKRSKSEDNSDLIDIQRYSVVPVVENKLLNGLPEAPPDVSDLKEDAIEAAAVSIPGLLVANVFVPSESEFVALFNCAGGVKRARLWPERHCGVAQLRTAEGLELALAVLDGSQVFGHALVVRRDVRKFTFFCSTFNSSRCGKAKCPGKHRCFNCFSPDHGDFECREPCRFLEFYGTCGRTSYCRHDHYIDCSPRSENDE